jgi:hypothetical protein
MTHSTRVLVVDDERREAESTAAAANARFGMFLFGASFLRHPFSLPSCELRFTQSEARNRLMRERRERLALSTARS